MKDGGSGNYSTGRVVTLGGGKTTVLASSLIVIATYFPVEGPRRRGLPARQGRIVVSVVVKRNVSVAECIYI